MARPFELRLIGQWVLSLAATMLLATSMTRAQESHFEGLGKHTRKISTTSADAQKHFDQGLAFLFGFNHDEALKSFHRAASCDQECAAIQWAIALTHGPHINFPMVPEAREVSASEALTNAKKHVAKASPVERDLLTALESRYSLPHKDDRRPLDTAYAAAMRKVWQKYPTDPDIGALFAEALMDLWPWDLWTRDGQPKDDTAEIVKTLETVLALQPDHPLALHLYIHAMEASPTPERAALAAQQLRDLQPGLGHMVHMPSHIDVRLGHWQRAIEANEKAIRADTDYRLKSPQQDFFRIYMAHNRHMLAFAAMMQGQSERSTGAINQMLKEIPESWLMTNAVFVDGMFSMPYEMHLRFGRWDAMLAEQEPRENLPISRVFRRYARGVAYAAKNQIPQARSEQQAFLEGKKLLPEGAMFAMNKAADVLAIADAMLEGEILYREGHAKEGIAKLRDAVRLEDQLRYIEPPDWIQPSRHVLGAMLLDAGQFVEAEAVYREDLKHHPHNGWSLHGLSQSLRAQGKTAEAEAAAGLFDKAWVYADVKLTSSCFCLPGKP